MRLLVCVSALLAMSLLYPAQAVAGRDWTWPVSGDVLTKYRNGSDPYASGKHRGIDVGAPGGQPVVAATGGTVTFAGEVGSAGRTVAIRTDDERFDTSYLHLSSIAVREGDRVRPGQRLGTVGKSGRRSTTAPHLHFGVRKAGTDHAYRDPLDFLGRPASRPKPPSAPPVPVGAPGPARPRPVRGPVRAPIPVASRSPFRVPGPLPLPSPFAAPVRSPVHRRESPRPAGRPAPSPARVRDRPAHSPELGPTPSRHVSPGDARLPSHARRDPATAGGPAGGIEVGWLAACIGFVLAAVALGRPARRRGGDDGDRGIVGALLRPLGGRG